MFITRLLSHINYIVNHFSFSISSKDMPVLVGTSLLPLLLSLSSLIFDKWLILSFAFIAVKENWQLILIMQDTRKRQKGCRIQMKVCQIWMQIPVRTKVHTLWIKGKKDFFVLIRPIWQLQYVVIWMCLFLLGNTAVKITFKENWCLRFFFFWKFQIQYSNRHAMIFNAYNQKSFVWRCEGNYPTCFQESVSLVFFIYKTMI